MPSLDSSSIPHEPSKKGPGNDLTCNGWGYLWRDAYDNEVKCWRCAGTGNVPNLVEPKASGPIQTQDDGIDGIRISTEEETNEGTNG
jgi:hypothetical protein